MTPNNFLMTAKESQILGHLLWSFSLENFLFDFKTLVSTFIGLWIHGSQLVHNLPNPPRLHQAGSRF